MKIALSKLDISNAQLRIKPFIHRTPILTASYFNGLLEAELFFKCENFQKAGAFKYRGATNAVLQLTEAQKTKGIIAHSSGNHAQALALAAKIQGIKAHIVMPSNAPKVKSEAVAGYGAKITFCEPTLEAREKTVKTLIEQFNYTEIHPFDNDHIIAGQATAAMELMEDAPNLDAIIAPIGGGGLLSGTALAAHYFGKNIAVYGGEPQGANDAKQSLDAGSLIPMVSPSTIADGLLTSLSPRTFAIIQVCVTDIITVSEKEILSAMKLVWERMKIIIEPSSSVSVAAVLKNKSLFKNKRVGIIISGGNVDFTNLPF
ncbi:Serine racemase @ L-serine dehydratase, (PLP)-dependent @ D-serine ammonia-lyase [hydrothermal vent metagenome]|uniref:Serine racemase @ L-serine dehydratase, (PLP)-dependent @ D-serine ammonia-lyase n=1 Tax=hydrothermal vent metagenome TaxID=652676 RepID=A0A3B0V3D6_9ZZZZ